MKAKKLNFKEGLGKLKLICTKKGRPRKYPDEIILTMFFLPSILW